MDSFDERREFVRMPASTPVHVRHSRKKAEGMILDISPGGCKLLCGDGLEKGEKVKLSFSLKPDEPSVDIEGEVMWVSRPDGSENVQHGIQFKEREKFEKLGPMFLDYLAFKKKMDVLRKMKKEKEGKTRAIRNKE